MQSLVAGLKLFEPEFRGSRILEHSLGGESGPGWVCPLRHLDFSLWREGFAVNHSCPCLRTVLSKCNICVA